MTRDAKVPLPPHVRVAVEKQKLVLRALRAAGGNGLTRSELIARTKLDLQIIDRTIRLVNHHGGRIEKCEAPAGSGARQVLVLLQEPPWYREVNVPARLALRVAKAVLPQIGSASVGRFLDLFEVLEEAQLSPKDQHSFEALLARVDVRGTVAELRKVNPSLLLEILEALIAKPSPPEVEILYQSSGGGEPKARTIIPHALILEAYAGAAYLLAWAQTSHGSQPLFFRLQRILRWSPSGKMGLLTPSERDHLDRAKRHQIGAWFEGEESFEIRVKVKAGTWLSAIMDSPPLLPGFRLEEPVHTQDSSRVVRFLATGLRGPARWVLQLGPDAEVLSPPEFRDHMGELAKDMVEMYELRPRPREDISR